MAVFVGTAVTVETVDVGTDEANTLHAWVVISTIEIAKMVFIFDMHTL
jgi:hypothetical protein